MNVLPSSSLIPCTHPLWSWRIGYNHASHRLGETPAVT